MGYNTWIFHGFQASSELKRLIVWDSIKTEGGILPLVDLLHNIICLNKWMKEAELDLNIMEQILSGTLNGLEVWPWEEKPGSLED